MKKMLYVFLGILVILGAGLLFAIRGLSETRRLEIHNVDISKVPDGTYQGKYEKGRFISSVQVHVKNGKVVDITPTGSEKTRSLEKKAFEEIYPQAIKKVIDAQSPVVDTVSGATATTKALLKAIENALINAGGVVVAK